MYCGHASVQSPCPSVDEDGAAAWVEVGEASEVRGGGGHGEFWACKKHSYEWVVYFDVMRATEKKNM